MNTISLAKLSGKYVGKKFTECSCMRLVYNWYSDLGIEVPYSFEDLSVDTYFQQWKIEKKSVLDTMVRLFNTLGKQVNINKLKTHDLLVVQETGNKYAAIYVGSGKAITSNIVEGVRVFHIGRFHKVILARRLI